VNFINATIAPVRELVIVIADLYLPPGEGADPARADVAAGTAPGMEYTARFGTREILADGWRAWLARRVGRADLAGVAPARIAAASCPYNDATAWIATPVQLIAGLTRVHLSPHGILRLPPPELAALADAFKCVFAGSGLVLHPLPCGEFLLFTAGMSPLATLEPARAAGADLAQSLPQGPQAGGLRRLGAEIEMWLHGEPVNTARARRDEPPVTSLWLWGSAGAGDSPPRVADKGVTVSVPGARAFGSDAWLDGLWRIQGSACETLPAQLDANSAEGNLAVWVVEARQGLAELDARFVAPALKALKGGAADRVTLIANDIATTLGPLSGRRFWRRARSGVGGLL
jgi:hypothetical protein